MSVRYILKVTLKKAMDFNNNVLSPFFFNWRIIALQHCVALHCTLFTLLRGDKKVTYYQSQDRFPLGESIIKDENIV